MPAPLVYSLTTSLDGFIAGPDGRFDWAMPDAEVHSFVNALFADARLHLYGRRMHEVMSWWDTVDLAELPPAEREWAEQYAVASKVVYSTTLHAVSAPNTELRSELDVDEVRAWRAEASGPIGVGGAGLASTIARAGLLDEIHQIIAPVVVGGGTRFLEEGLDLRLELIDERRFGNGFAYLAYRVLN